MKILKNYDQHPWRTIIILLIIAFIIGLIQENVFAATCETMTPNTQYLNSNNTYSTYSGQSVVTNSFRIRDLKSGGIGTDPFSWSGQVFVTVPQYNDDLPTYSYQYRNGNNTWVNLSVDNRCQTRTTISYTMNDDLVLSTTYKVVWECKFTPTDNLNIIYLQIDKVGMTQLSNRETCYVKNPTENDNNIEQNMYNYYSSLWDKSTISENKIIDSVENEGTQTRNTINQANQDIQEAIEQQTDDLLNAPVNTTGQNSQSTSNIGSAETGEGTIRGTISTIGQGIDLAAYEYWPQDTNAWTFVSTQLQDFAFTGWPMYITLSILTLGMIKLILGR